jgi:tetratricopeptide (TPR) repeat protein
MASDDQDTRDAYAEVAEMADRVGLAEELALAALGSGGRGDMAAAPDPRLIGLLERALSALGRSDSRLRSRVLSRLSAALTLIPDTRGRREELTEQAIRIAERTGDSDALAFALVGRQLALCGPGHLQDRSRLSVRLLDLVEREGTEESLVMGLQWRAHALLEAGDITAADQIMQRYASLSDELRQPGYQVHMAEWRAMRALHDGRLADAEGLIAAMLALGQHGDPMNTQMRYVSQMCALRREQGRLDEMVDAIFAVVAAMPSMPAFRGGAAVAAIETGREAEARAHFETLAADDFAGFPRDAAWAGGIAQLARVCAALGDAPRAAVLYDLLLPDADRNLVIGFANVSEGAASHFLGMLAATQGRDEEAARHFEAALAMNARMGARPALAHTQREYARLCLRRNDGNRTAELLAAAMATYEALGMTSFVERTRALRNGAPTRVTQTDGASRGANVFVREGDYWTVTYDGAVLRLKDGKGLRYVAELLRSPGRRTHVLDLVAAVDGTAGDGAHRSTARLAGDDLVVQRPGAIPDAPDARARSEYRQRATELQDQLAEAERQNDIGRTAHLRAEIDQIGAELASAYGIGLERRANDAVERARKAVTNRIRAVVDHVRKQHPPLARHLSTSFRLGTWCSYEPAAPVGWQLGG